MKKINVTCKGADSIPIDSIDEFQGNLKKLSKSNLDKLKRRIIKDGINVPLFIWRTNDWCRILDGHQRLKALLSLRKDGYELPMIPVAYIEAENEKDARQKLLGITSQFGEFEIEELESWMSEIDADIADTLRFTDTEIKIDIEPEETENDDEFDEDVESITKDGDLWELGNHRLLCGDSTDIEQVENLLNGEKADMVFTDPPYNVSFNGRSGKFEIIKNDNLTDEDFKEFIEKWLTVLKKINPNTYYICCNWKFYGILQSKLKPKACIVWAKNEFGLGRGYRHQHEFILFDGFIKQEIKNETDLWTIKKDSKYEHPTQKPVDLPMRAINNSSKDGNIIIDFFSGSGPSFIACEKTNRICYGMELDPHYCDVIVNRYKKWCQDNDKEYSVKLNGKDFNAE